MKVRGVDLHVEDTGGTGPAIAFSHGLLSSVSMWRFQLAAFRDRFRCVAWDHRGQGRSELTEGGYDMDTLADDAAALIAQLGIAPVHFVGLSMGGFVGMRLAARRPELVRSLALMETAADAEPWRNALKYSAMSFLARFLTIRPFVPAVTKIMFGRTFRSDPGRAALREAFGGELIGNDLTGMRRALDGVLSRRPVSPQELASIRAPVLVVSGEEDTAVVPARSIRLAAQIPGAKFVRLPRAGHTSSMEEPEAVNHILGEFWGSAAGTRAAADPRRD
ncbi:MAG: alpha/beta fold hydrolase [Deltaproteobacteria bacterium]|nr:MAG: alpha/beta fold hydrolase [Deltaproteobacteria bacterium]